VNRPEWPSVRQAQDLDSSALSFGDVEPVARGGDDDAERLVKFSERGSYSFVVTKPFFSVVVFVKHVPVRNLLGLADEMNGCLSALSKPLDKLAIV